MEWWIRIDRQEALAAVRKLVPAGGTLILLGDDDSGRPQAMDLVEEYLRSFSYAPLKMSGFPHPLTVRAVLLRTWRALAPSAPTDQVGPWLTQGLHMTLTQMVDEVAAVAHSDPGNAILVRDVDFHQPLLAAQLSLLADLGQKAECPVVLTSRAESGTDWDSLESRVLNLRRFVPEDVRSCLNNAPELKDRTVGELDELMRRVCGDEMDGEISPLTAYTTLETSAVA